MLRYRKRFIELLRTPLYIIPVILVLIGGYGFVATHISIGIDDLAFDRYNGMEFLAQGRFIKPLLSLITRDQFISPVIPDLLYGILMIFSCTAFLCLFETYSNARFNSVSCAIFSALLISYPLVAELYVYNHMVIIIGFGFFFSVCSIYEALDWIEYKRKSSLIKAVLFSVSYISLYESFVMVYICAVFGLFIIKSITPNTKVTWRGILHDGIIFLIVLLCGIILEYLVSESIIAVLSIKHSTVASTSIPWFDGSITENFKSLFINFSKMFISGLWYLPLKVYFVCVFLLAALSIYWSIKKNQFIIIALFIAFVVSTLLLGMIQCFFAYRTLQVFSLFTAFTALCILYTVSKTSKKTGIKGTVIVLFSLLIIWQTIDLNNWFVLENQKYEEEKAVLLDIAEDIKDRYDFKKPVVFVGKYELSNYINARNHVHDKDLDGIFKLIVRTKLLPSSIQKKWNDGEGDYTFRYTQTTIKSYITWSIYAFGEMNTELFKLLRYLGIDYIIRGTENMYADALRGAVDLPAWPDKRAIVDTEEYILVNFGID